MNVPSSEIILREPEILECVDILADYVDSWVLDLQPNTPIIGVANASVLLIADLLPRLKHPYTFRFWDPHIENFPLIYSPCVVIDTLYDSGATMDKVLHSNIRCCLFSKKRYPRVQFYAKEVPEIFLFGYGLDDRDGTKRGLRNLYGRKN